MAEIITERGAERSLSLIRRPPFLTSEPPSLLNFLRQHEDEIKEAVSSSGKVLINLLGGPGSGKDWLERRLVAWLKARSGIKLGEDVSIRTVNYEEGRNQAFRDARENREIFAEVTEIGYLPRANFNYRKLLARSIEENDITISNSGVITMVPWDGGFRGIDGGTTVYYENAFRRPPFCIPYKRLDIALIGGRKPHEVKIVFWNAVNAIPLRPEYLKMFNDVLWVFGKSPIETLEEMEFIQKEGANPWRKVNAYQLLINLAEDVIDKYPEIVPKSAYRYSDALRREAALFLFTKRYISTNNPFLTPEQADGDFYIGYNNPKIKLPVIDILALLGEGPEINP